MSREKEYGIAVVSDPANAIADVVFVHGLTGHRETTWTASKDNVKCFWPSAILAKDLPFARILTWGYSADVVNRKILGNVSGNSMARHAKNLCLDLTNFRIQSKTLRRPTIFVAHSLGGLICKSAILHAAGNLTSEDNDLGDIAGSLYGITFMGTPHQGSELASWGELLRRLLDFFKQTNNKLLKELEKDTKALAELQDKFQNFLRLREQHKAGVHVVCFFEEFEEPVLRCRVLEKLHVAKIDR